MPNSSILPVVGLPQFDGWSQVVERQGDWGLFILSFSVEGQHASNIGRDVVTMLEEKPVTSPRIFHQRLQEISAHVKYNGAKIHLAAGLLLKDKILLAVESGLVFLKRGNRMGVVTESEKDLKLIEGSRLPDDIYMFMTGPAKEFLSEIEIKFDQGYDAPTTVTSIVPSVHKSESTAISSIGVVYLEQEAGESSVRPKPKAVVRPLSQSNPQGVMPELSATEPVILSTNGLEQETYPKVKVAKAVLGGLLLGLGRGSKKMAVILGRTTKSLLKLLIRIILKVWRLVTTSFGQGKLRVESNRDRKQRVIAVVILLGFIVVLIWLGWLWRQRRATRTNTTQAIAPIVAGLESTRSQALEDPLGARTQVETYRQQLQTIWDQNDSSIAREIIERTQLQADALYEEVSGFEQPDALDQFYDLRLASLDFVSSRTTGDDSQAVFLDTEKQKLLLLSLINKSVEELDLLELDPVRDVTLIEGRVAILAGGVLGLTKEEGEESASWENLISVGDSNRDGTFMRSFGQNIYVFSPKQRNIYKYIQDRSGAYSTPVAWLTSPLGVPFDEVTSMAVDGDIWLTTIDGQIKRFSSGKAQEFKLSGMDQPFAGPLTIITSQDLQALYVLEPAADRVVVLNKDGQFLKEIKSSVLGTATTIIVSQEIQKILAVSGSILYQIDL